MRFSVQVDKEGDGEGRDDHSTGGSGTDMSQQSPLISTFNVH